MLKVILTVFLLCFSLLAHSAVRFNPQTGLWEGNICANQFAWTYVATWQPVGSFCIIRMPNGQVFQGIIINQ